MSASILLGLSLVVIGDSHFAEPSYLIGPMHDQLIQKGAKVYSIGVCGAMPADWVKATQSDCGRADRVNDEPRAVRIEAGGATTPIKDLIASTKANAIIIVSGDTIGSYKSAEFPKTWAYQQVTALTKAIAETDTACYWVGPGWSNKPGRYGKTNERVQAVNSFLAENTLPCTYIDSTKMSEPGEWKTIDGQHYNSSAYRAWGTAIVTALESAATANPPKKTP
jgi:hypothetical protein